MERGRVRQVLLGFGVILGVVALFILLAWVAGMRGFIGEFARVLAGVFTTPLLLEPAFLLLGLLIVLALNYWRRHRDGPECVYLEQVEDAAGLPEQARFAVYVDPPLDGEEPGPLTRAEGALEIGDLEAAAAALAELDPAELDSPGALPLRIRLARAAGREELAAELERRLAGQREARRPRRG